MAHQRRTSREIKVGSTSIGGHSPITVQSMTNSDPHDFEATLRQTSELFWAGCDIVRISAPDLESATLFKFIRERGITSPLVADVHFDYRIAVAAAEAGVDKLRINPGNIGSRAKVREVVEACKANGTAIRIGVNSGSLEKDILLKHGSPTAEALAESALRHLEMLEEENFYNTVLSVKSSDTETMIRANRILAEKTDYPLHLGVTEAGGGRRALIKSSVGIGSLLNDGIGDTVRISLTDDPVREVEAARELLSVLGLSRTPEMDIISCPTCGRTKIDLIPLVAEFERVAKAEGLYNKSIKVAIMGCAVNGPGEAREADIGVAGGVGEALLFKRGEILKKIKEKDIISELIREIRLM